ncbi:outer membrane protein assembly factor BamB family protein [Gimesia aquarii]|uniref:Quinohemoprotein ethanol dehydrogenase type-1 n=1 Tax=Gimesia aquarii TaxID=2527964 RepID=A0A517VTE0_9PLAN|nr:PQQ-binding-like beta-propeller repeat protein [Gimesia aquarii]QDT96229.1 Quinohemoprotein ethanol dehydrogenase type-1 precursor [Gimesia aquarii]
MKKFLFRFALLNLLACFTFVSTGCESRESTTKPAPGTETDLGGAAPIDEAGSTTGETGVNVPEPDADPKPSEPELDPDGNPVESKVEAKPKDTELAKAAPKKGEGQPTSAGKKSTITGDWTMWGGSPSRNMVNKTTGVSIDFKPGEGDEPGENILWVSKLGSQTYGNPVVADGQVYVGTNNGGKYRPQYEDDLGVVLCFDEKTGDFKWQLSREKLPQGRVNDWPEQGICAAPCVEGDRLWVVTNRCELMCLDANGFYDNENDGPVKDEKDTDKKDADIIWSLDMIEDLGVFPHNLATSSPVVHGDYVFLLTSNGVDEAHLEVPAPRAPCFLAVNKKTGKVVWEDNTPFDQILHGQWSSPAIGEVNGQVQVYFPGGDGWLYAFTPEGDGDGNAKLIWKFDLNPKDSKWELGGRGTRNAIISTPVFYDNSVILGVGQDPEHGEGVGHIYRIDATKTGDISPQISDGKKGWKDNPNSGQIWHYGGEDVDGKLTGKKGELLFRRTMSTVAVADGLVYAPDLSGFVHCLDLATGKRYWEYDMFAACWGSPMVVDGKVFIGNEDGMLVILEAGKEKKLLDEKTFNSSIYSTPTIANGKMYISDRSQLYSIKVTD